MIRVLVLIAVTGFLVSVVTLSTAVAIGGPDLLAHAAWGRWSDGDWDWGWNSKDHHHRWGYHHSADEGPPTTRELAWTGSDTLEIDVPAEVTYTQAPGPGKLTVTGPKDAVDALEIDGGQLRFSGSRHHWADLTIAMTAPAVTRFDLHGSSKLAIEGYRQDRLNLDVSGDADVSARGEAKALDLTISGSADTDLSGLKLENADVNITGAGEATLAPAGSANLNISGSGDVTLLTRPAKLESNVTGSGSVHQKEAATASPSPALSPAPKPGKRL
ncbi:GIN domain-containing protein [Phenylobacterium sp.]|jgi:hypothetical protein|uniref:GIN domain-containing protein n=1 Tax=Phenylobacterium sp. TaxID=1871053 RepID=UPI002E3354E0|nr:DUF2807 domain-containing protein [Phenylobacterium sp.]HEX4710555.1 DUF2807 domain-containing protein [Phenylobacterium sp.]